MKYFLIILLALTSLNAFADDEAPKKQLNSNVKVDCYGLYAVHTHEADVSWNTTGNKVEVPKITLHSKIGKNMQEKVCTNSDSCSTVVKEYDFGCNASCAWAEVEDQSGNVMRTKETCNK